MEKEKCDGVDKCLGTGVDPKTGNWCECTDDIIWYTESVNSYFGSEGGAR